MAFQFNDCDVCTNPEVVIERKAKGIEYALKVAEHGGGWYFGLSASISYQTVTQGVTWPVVSTGYKHATRDEAIVSAAGNLVNWANSIVRQHPETTPILKQIIQIEYLILPKSEQLTLF